MKHQPWTNLLLGLVAVSVLATAALAFFYVRSVQKLNRLQFQASVVNRNRALVNALAAETVEYGKRNPAMQALLQSVGIRANPSANAPSPARP
jgi:hypothetical protein